MSNDKKNDKYEDEIREILNRMDWFDPEENRRSQPRKKTPPPWSGWKARLRRQFYTYNSTNLLAGMVMFALAAWFFSRVFPPFGFIAALMSVGCLLGAIMLPMLSRRYGRPEKKWRGRVIDFEPAKIRRPFSWRYTWWRIKSLFRLR